MSDITITRAAPSPPTRKIEICSFKSDQHLTLICQKLYQFYRLHKFVDIDLIIGHNIIQAHRIVLIATSEYFFDVFTKQPNINCLSIPEVNEGVMLSILRFMYTSSIDLEPNSVEGVLKAAALFKLNLLIENCSIFMEKIINLGNCLRIASLAWEFKMHRLLISSMHFAHLHFKELRYKRQFLMLKPEILREFFSSDFLQVDSEDVVVESLLDWANFDANNRNQLLAGLLSVVRYELLDSEFITNVRERTLEIPDCADVIFGWATCHIEYQLGRTKSLIRTRNMNHKYSFLCGESTDDWNVMTYDILLDTWSSEVLPNSLQKRSWFKSVMTEDKKIIIAGGKTNGNITSNVDCLNLQTQEWKTLCPMPEARLGHAMTLLKGDLYVFGGSCKSILLSVMRYNFVTDSWSTVCPLPGEIAYSHRYAIVNDQLYIMDFFRPKKFKCFDSLLSEMTEYDFDHDVEKGYDMVAIGDDIFMCLCESGSKSIERYSPSDRTWTEFPSAGIERFVCPRMFAISSKIIFWGKAVDESETSTPLSLLVEMYDIEKRCFTSLKPLTENLADLNIK